jgi:thiosulfate reductase cytochrome b subunit
MSQRIYLYPVAIRVWHLINALMIILLIITGVSLQYSDPSYSLMRFDIAVNIHNYAGILLTINYFLFLIANIVSGNIKHYKFKIQGYIGKLWKQFHYYSRGIFKGDPAPFPITTENKFNPLQQFSYILVMYLFLPILVLSGFALLFPGMVPDKIFGFGGIRVADFFHIINGFFATVFLIIHIYFCTIGKKPLKNFKSIINGWHENNH